MIDLMPIPMRKNEMPYAGAGPSALAANTEADLVSRMRAGDEEAYEIIVRRYTPRLSAVAGRFLRSEEDCADAVQDAFLSAFRSLGSFAGKARLSTWLHRIVVNVCLMKLRSRSRNAEIPLDDLLPSSDRSWQSREPEAPSVGSAISDLASAETRAQVRACIDRLPPSYRTVLVLRDLKELDTERTAQTIGTSHAVVKTRLHRARRALRTLLEPWVTESGK
jgi:RNA polymerase sigma-70 factor, ECF subfamily